jgi:N-terminal domain of anti-restriction factor ArdC
MSYTENTATEKRDVYATVTSQIVNAIEQGVSNWRMPWHTSGKFAFSPINVASKKLSLQKNPKVRTRAEASQSARLLRGVGRWYIDRGGALPREAAGLRQALDPVRPSHRMRVRRRGVRSDDADRPLHESPPQHPLLEAVFFVTAVHLCQAPSEFSSYGNKRSTP